jgi:hypothetical protein
MVGPLVSYKPNSGVVTPVFLSGRHRAPSRWLEGDIRPHPNLKGSSEAHVSLRSIVYHKVDSLHRSLSQRQSAFVRPSGNCKSVVGI